MEIKNLENYINDNILDTIYRSREDAINEISESDKIEIAKIKERYPIGYEELLISINNLPPHFKNMRENILEVLDAYMTRETLISAYENEKSYKIGFCDGIRTIVENLETKK